MKKSNRKAASRQDAAQYVAPTMAAFLLTMPFATSAWAAPAVEADTELSNRDLCTNQRPTLDTNLKPN